MLKSQNNRKIVLVYLFLFVSQESDGSRHVRKKALTANPLNSGEFELKKIQNADEIVDGSE